MENEEQYQLETLLQNSDAIFDQPRFVAEGAAAKENLSGLVTKSELSQAIQDFLAQKDSRHQEG
jgi:hypothetical protein